MTLFPTTSSSAGRNNNLVFRKWPIGTVKETKHFNYLCFLRFDGRPDFLSSLQFRSTGNERAAVYEASCLQSSGVSYAACWHTSSDSLEGRTSSQSYFGAAELEGNFWRGGGKIWAQPHKDSTTTLLAIKQVTRVWFTSREPVTHLGFRRRVLV